MNFKIEAISILLNEDCIVQRYYPLIPYRDILIKNLSASGYYTKKECISLSDDTLREFGLPNEELMNLFRKFLVLYDVKASKFKDIESISENESEASAFRELYLLPGVNSTRAKLYYHAGYVNLISIASAIPEQIIKKTSDLNTRCELNLKAPLPKEVRTHIAVAKTLTEFAVSE